MKEQLMTLTELGELLQYSDMRSIENWCKKNKIPILTAGKQKYVMAFFVDLYFKSEVAKFVSVYYTNPNEILSAIDSNNSIQLVELADSKHNPKNKSMLTTTVEHSKAALQFLNNIKST